MAHDIAAKHAVTVAMAILRWMFALNFWRGGFLFGFLICRARILVGIVFGILWRFRGCLRRADIYEDQGDLLLPLDLLGRLLFS